MPGVPSGRGCDACRSAKKKCDCSVPRCSRCVRMDIDCIGAGVRRFQFKDRQCSRRRPSPPSTELIALSTPVDSDLYRLRAAFLEMIKPSTQTRFNLLTTCGSYLIHLPQRLGTSEALDAAAHALVLSHHDICSYRPTSLETLHAYSVAIRKLRIALDNPTEARSINSVGAAMLLLTCQNLSGFTPRGWGSHCRGAAQIANARKRLKAKDAFESELLESLAGPVAMQCLLLRDMRLDPDKFRTLAKPFENDMEPDSVLRHICRIPEFLRRGRLLQPNSAELQQLHHEILTIYQALFKIKDELRAMLDTKHSMPQGLEWYQLVAGYAFIVSLCCVYNCILSSPKFEEQKDILNGSTLVDATLELANEIADIRPLGTGSVLWGLPTAWLCTGDATKAALIEQIFHDFQQDFRRDQNWTLSIGERMTDLRHDLQFGAVPDGLFTGNEFAVC